MGFLLKISINKGNNSFVVPTKPQLKTPMSLEASTNLIIPEPGEELIANEPWSMETYADGLIDELFAEIDSILDGSEKLPSQTALSSAYTDLQTVKMQHLALPDTQIQTAITVPQLKNNQLDTVVVNTPTISKTVNKPVRKSPQRSHHWFSQMVRVGATSGLAIAGIVWIVNSGLLNRLESKYFQQVLEIPQPQLQAQSLTKEDVKADFVNYMLAALAIIDRQDTNDTLSSTNVAFTPKTVAPRTALAYVKNETTTENLPPVVAANNTSPLPSRSTNVVERIYIPVYQAPLPMRYVPSPASNLAATLPQLPFPTSKTVPNASKPTDVKTSQNIASTPGKSTDVLAVMQSNLKPVDVKTAPIPVQQAPKQTVPSLPNLIAPPKLPTATTPEPEPEPVKQEVVSVVTAATPSHTLEGLLELGDKSAALFKINGVSRRIEIGESIGFSGWTLVDVANGEAVIRRNGEVRSVFAGQKF